MRTALHIFQKDVRRLWPVIAAVLSLHAISIYVESPRAHGLENISSLAGLLHMFLPLSIIYMVAAVIQEESLCDDRQFWMTRPYSRPSLLAAKAIFVVAFVYVPFLASDAIRLAWKGLPLGAHLPHMLWRQVAFSGWSVLGATAIAAVTRGLVQFTFTGLAMVLAAAAFPIWTGKDDAGAFWGRMDWIRAMSQLVVFVVTTLAVILLQYSRRKLLVSRAVLAGGFALTLATMVLLPWEAAFAVQSRVTGSRADASGVQIAFDSSRGPLNRIAGRTSGLKAYVTIPVSLAGLPAGTEPVFDVARVRMDSPGAPSWDSGWRSDVTLSAQDRAQWAQLAIDRRVFDGLKSRAVEIRATVAVTLFADGERIFAPAKPGEVSVPGGGTCTIDGSFPLASLTCHLNRGSHRILVNVEDPGSGASSPRFEALEPGYYGPSAADVDITPYTLSSRQLPDWFRTGALGPGARFVFTSQRPAAHILRDFTARGIKLADYEVTTR